MNLEHEKAAILHLYETTRQGHLEGNAAKLLAQYAPHWHDLRDGTVVPRTLADEHTRIATQLATTHFLSWDDLTPPRIDISPDGTMAYLLGEIRATATQTHPNGSTSDLTYRCSFLQIYTRHNGQWAAVVNAPSVKLES